MNKSSKNLGQYLFENHGFRGTTDEFLEQTAPLIGYLVHDFNSLDAQLNSEICELINDRTDEPGAIIIHKMTFSAKVELFNNLVQSMESACKASIPDFQKLIDRLRECGKLRNAVVHAEWDSIDEKGYTYVKMSFTNKAIHQHYWQFTPDSLKAIIKYIQETNSMFDQYEDGKQDLLRK